MKTFVDSGFEIVPGTTQHFGSFGVCLFRQADEELYRFLTLAAKTFGTRIIAVDVSPGETTPKRSWWSVLRAGASDVISLQHAEAFPDSLVQQFKRWSRIDSHIPSDELIGNSTVWKNVLRQVIEAAFGNNNILLTGESGTGKELVSRLIHDEDNRQNKGNFVTLDCTTVVPALSGSEFFGHERGAFTGAAISREGAFSLAHQGTLFLDEVGELPLTLQGELLRVIQEGAFKKIGSNIWEKTSFRLICATNKDLATEVRENRFRSDFYYRIAGWKIHLPPLRDRRDDILPLARYFISQFRADLAPVEFVEPVEHFLHRREYPGNVRDLKQLMQQIANRHVGQGPISIGDIPADERPADCIQESTWRGESLEQSVRHALALGIPLKQIRAAAEEEAIRIVLEEENGNLQRAAQKLGVTDRALQIRKAAQRKQNGSSNGFTN